MQNAFCPASQGKLGLVVLEVCNPKPVVSVNLESVSWKIQGQMRQVSGILSEKGAETVLYGSV